MSWQYPGQQADHTLTPLKGWWSIQTALDIEGTIDAAVNIGGVGTPPLSGQCVHVASLVPRTSQQTVASGPSTVTFQMGANLNQMPCFLFPNAVDFDVQNPGVPSGVALGGTIGTPPAWIPAIPSGFVMALVGKGAYELETTEFDTSQTYAANDFLRAVTSNTDVNAGKLTNQNASGGAPFASPGKNVWGTAPSTTATWDSIVGRVSRGVYTNANNKSALAFWPESLPGGR